MFFYNNEVFGTLRNFVVDDTHTIAIILVISGLLLIGLGAFMDDKHNPNSRIFDIGLVLSIIGAVSGVVGFFVR